MDITALTSLLAHYTDEIAIDWHALPRTTSGNDAYIVTTNKNKYVLRVLAHQQSPQHVEEECKLQHALKDASIVTPIYRRTLDGELIAHTDRTSGTLSDYIEGRRPENITPRLVASMGSTLAKVHEALRELTVQPNELQWFDPRNVTGQFEEYTGPKKEVIKKLIDVSSTIFSKSLPKTLIHGDLHIHNLFADNDEVTVVFDLESSEYTFRLFDVARTGLTLIKGSDLESNAVENLLIDAYNQTASMQLTQDELKALPEAFVYVAAVTALSIYNNGNEPSSKRYIELAERYSHKS
jgi:Ser/Thr protein kinase RdoA (MazF antagonist)